MTGALQVLFWIFVVALLLGALDNMVSRGDAQPKAIARKRRGKHPWYWTGGIL